MPLREQTVVILDLDFINATERFDEELAMLALFGETKGFKLLETSGLIYQSANYDAVEVEGAEVWAGEMLALREHRLARVRRDERGRFVTDPDEVVQPGEDLVPAVESRTRYAYFPDLAIMAWQETSALPYTRLQSYLKYAQELRPERLTTEVQANPRMEERSLREQLASFEELTTVRLRFRHSQSPGRRSVDERFHALNAELITEVIAAKRDQSLNVHELIDGDSPEADVVTHLDVNNKNGDVFAVGKVNGRTKRLDTADPIVRPTITTEDGLTSYAIAARRLVQTYL